jgi:hypothetical protein
MGDSICNMERTVCPLRLSKGQSAAMANVKNDNRICLDGEQHAVLMRFAAVCGHKGVGAPQTEKRRFLEQGNGD